MDSKKEIVENETNSFFIKQKKIINEYIDLTIMESNIFLYISCLLTSFFLYQKFNDNFMAHWRVTFYPLYIYLITYCIYYFYLIIYSDMLIEKKGIDKSNILSNIFLISNFFSFILYILCITEIYNIHQFLDTKNDDYLFSSFFILIIIFSCCLIYSFIRQLSIFSIREIEKFKSIYLSFASSLIAPALTYLSNMMIICSGGACTQIYVSTITSLLGAFGVTISNLSKYMFPITCILMIISVFSLYIKKRKITHPPFILGTFSAFIIIFGKYYEKTFLKYLIYPGNILMIIAAIWNAKLNNFTGIPMFHQKNEK